MSGPWFQLLRPSRASAPRLYCFPYAGGVASAFRLLANEIRRDVQVWAASLPGRRPRWAEPPEHDLGRLVSSLADGVVQGGVHEFAFLGHSMGALVAFELARELRRRRLAMPAGLIVSGARAPQFLGDEPARRHELPTEQLLDVLRSLGGTPPEVLDSPELVDLVLPALRADFKICETYRYTSEPALSAPLMVLFGQEDAEVRSDHVAGWRLQTTGEFAARGFAGDHFFIERDWVGVGRIVNAFVDRLWSGRPEASPPSSHG